MLRYSRQRELIINDIKNRCDHPTAEMIYSSVREKDETISLGTVYRNLKNLSGEGEVSTLETEDKKIRYDGNTDGHAHFVCKSCGKIEDIFENVTDEEVIKKYPFEISEKKIVFYGLCEDCLNKSIRK